ncbi:claudin-15 isoform 2-T2 [Glossophaga mutica]
MSVAVETFGFFLAAVGLLMLGVTLPHSYWRVSTVHGNVITTNTIFENLWHSCATDSMGVYNCRDFPSMLALSGTRWRFPRGLRLQCSSLPGPGCCGMVAISWYASNITQDFFNPLYSGTKYELGPALYLGWSASLLAILGGVCLCSNCCKAPDQDSAASTRLSYKAPAVRSAALAAHLPPAASDGEDDNSFGKYGKNAYV